MDMRAIACWTSLLASSGLAFAASDGQTYKCPGNVYSNTMNAAEAAAKNCLPLVSAPASGASSTPALPPPKARPATAQVSPRPEKTLSKPKPSDGTPAGASAQATFRATFDPVVRAHGWAFLSEVGSGGKTVGDAYVQGLAAKGGSVRAIWLLTSYYGWETAGLGRYRSEVHLLWFDCQRNAVDIRRRTRFDSPDASGAIVGGAWEKSADEPSTYADVQPGSMTAFVGQHACTGKV